jgi:hypothetical protein
MKKLVILFQIVLLASVGGCSELQQRRGFESCAQIRFERKKSGSTLRLPYCEKVKRISNTPIA